MASTPTGIYNPADFIKQLNGTYKNDDGTTRSGSRGTIFEKNVRKLQPNTQAYFNELLYNEAMNAKAEGRALNRFDMKKIEHMLRAKYGNVDPKLKFFDISSWYSTNGRIAKELTNYINSVASQPTNDQPPSEEPEQKPDKMPETTQTQAQTETKENPNQKYIDAYHRLKQKKGTDEDLALFADWSEDKLKKFGFGPVTIKAIRDYVNKPEETRPQPGEMSDRHRQELELQKQERAKNAEQSATDYLGTSNFLNTGGFGASTGGRVADTSAYKPREGGLLDKIANKNAASNAASKEPKEKEKKSLTTKEPGKNVNFPQANVGKVPENKTETKKTEQPKKDVATKEPGKNTNFPQANVGKTQPGDKPKGTSIEDAKKQAAKQNKSSKDKKTDTQPGDKPVSEISRAYAEANGER